MRPVHDQGPDEAGEGGEVRDGADDVPGDPPGLEPLPYGADTDPETVAAEVTEWRAGLSGVHFIAG